MLQLIIPITPEGWDEEKEMFVEAQTVVLDLEHSLSSISKWESKWCKSFIATKELTVEETIDYMKCMTLTKDVDPKIWSFITNNHIYQVTDYISAPMTATTVKEDKSAKKSNEIITAELIYYWMIASNIPFECDKWHLNKLLMLIRVCSAKNAPSKKMSRKEQFAQQRALNAARRKKHNSRG